MVGILPTKPDYLVTFVLYTYSSHLLNKTTLAFGPFQNSELLYTVNGKIH